MPKESSSTEPAIFTAPIRNAPSPTVTDSAVGSGVATARMMLYYVYITNFTLASVEMMSSASMPLYLEKTFGNMSLMADLSIIIMFASVIGNQFSPLVINRFTLKSSYLGLTAAAFLTAMTIGGIANFGAMTVPLLFSLFFLYRMLQAASLTAENVVIPSVYGKGDQRAMEDLRGHKQCWNAVASALTQNSAAAFIILLGWTRNFIIAPCFYVIAMALAWFTLKIPSEADQIRKAAWDEKMRHNTSGALNIITATFKNYGRQIARGYIVVMHDPVLAISTMAADLIIMFKWLTFLLLPQLFAKFVIGPHADASQAAPIMGLIVGLFSFGGLFAGKYVAKQAKDLVLQYRKDTAAIHTASHQSTIQWLKYSALSFLLIGVLALPIPTIGPLFSPDAITAAVVNLVHAAAGLFPTRLLLAGVLGLGTIIAMWRPKPGLVIAMIPVFLAFPLHVILAALAFFVFGAVQVVATLKNDSFFDAAVQVRAPSALADARAFVGASSMLVGMLGLVALKFLFYGKLPFGIPSPFPSFLGLPGIWPFIVTFGALVVPTTLAFYWAAHRLDMLTKPASSSA